MNNEVISFIINRISSRASECNNLMRKFYYNNYYGNVKDFKSGRKYMYLALNILESKPQFNFQKFQHLECLNLILSYVIIDDAFDHAMNSLICLKTLVLEMRSLSLMSSTKSWTLDNLECLRLFCSIGFFSPGQEVN